MPKKKQPRSPNLTSVTQEDAHVTNLSLPSQEWRNAVTLPNTPLKFIDSTPTKTKQKSRTDLAADRTQSMARIKSLTKMDIRSPLIARTPGVFGLSPIVTRDDQASLYTTRTTRTIALRIFSIVPNVVDSARSYYNDFTTIDWAKAYIHTNKFMYEVHHGTQAGNLDEQPRKTHSVLKKLYYDMGKWMLIVVVAFFFALIAYTIDKIEILLVGLKYGYCRSNWFASLVLCCASVSGQKAAKSARSPLFLLVLEECPDWISWLSYFHHNSQHKVMRVDFAIYVLLTVGFALLAGSITLTTKIPARLPASKRKIFEQWANYDGNYDSGAENALSVPQSPSTTPILEEFEDSLGQSELSLTLYTAAGSGVPEVKTILSGFVIRRFLGTYTLFAKTAALICAIASGMALGKEGPYVHLATCVGNILSRLIPFINDNDYLKKEVLSASASSGVALAFGSPLGGVLFILEEINHYLPSNQLFLIFFCAITSTLFLKFLNPYGTNKTVLFELNYTSDWRAGELPFFVLIGIAGGLFGAAFIQFTRWWPKKFRQSKLIKNHPLVEIALVSLLTGVVTFWNPYTRQDLSELVLDLATSCSLGEIDSSLCPTDDAQFVQEIARLFLAFAIKVILTFITFGIKAPCGIYVPSMVAGALFGRLFAMCIQLAGNRLLATGSPYISAICPSNDSACVDLGIYSMISAGAFMAGVTRMNITLVTILFELTSSYTYVLPIAIAIAVANWFGGLIEENSLYESLLIVNDYPFMSPEKDAVDPYTSARDLLSPQTIFTDSATNSPEESKVLSLAEVETLGKHSERRHGPGNQRNEHEIVAHAASSGASELDKLFIDISQSPYVTVSRLQRKLMLLAKHSLLDGCIALVKDQNCVGTIYFSELEFCLDKIVEFSVECDLSDELYCKVYETTDYNVKQWETHKLHNEIVLEEALELRRLANSSFASPEADYFNYGSNSEYLNFKDDKLALGLQMRELCNLTSYADTSVISISHDSPLALAHLIFDRIGTRTVILQRKGKYYGLLHKKAFVDFCRRPKH